MIKIIHNVSTGEITEVELTESELAKIEQDKETYATVQAEAEARATQRQAIFDRLGLTAEEAQLLLGGN